MAESRPFLRSPFVTPDPNSGNWSSSHSSFSDDDDGEAQLYSTNDEKYGNSAEQFPDSVVEPQRPAKRSRARLILLVLLAIGVTVSISAWRAPDHVRTKAADMAHQVQHAASDQWKGAKEWSGWSSNPNTGGVGLDDPKVDLSIMDEDQPHPLYVLPDPPWDTSGYASERFLSYMPHSGYHNQRIELSNALSLAKMLNRTLLLPPVWIGWPVVTQPYSQLQSTWDKVMAAHTESFKERHNEHHRLHKRQSNDSQDKQLTEEECKSYAKECKSTYKDTFVAWRFLTNIEKARDRLSIVDRFNMTEAFAREKAGVQSDDDVVSRSLDRFV